MEEAGIFRCPNCKIERLGGYTKWRKKIINGEERWIFFCFQSNRNFWKYPFHNKWVHKYYNYIKEVYEFLCYNSPEECWKKTGGRSEEENGYLSECENCGYKASSFKEFILKE